jgi:hypothetical protein
MSNPTEVYTRLLLLKGHGCPIWCPEPDENLAYGKSGVRIGHVGRIDQDDGSFNPLFNICTGEDDPINCNGVRLFFLPVLSILFCPGDPFYYSVLLCSVMVELVVNLFVPHLTHNFH